MRTKKIPNVGEIIYPENWICAHNSNWLMIRSHNHYAARIVVTGVSSRRAYGYDIAIVGGKAFVDISEPIRMLLETTAAEQRWVKVHVAVEFKRIAIASFHVIALAAGVPYGGTNLSSYGVIKHDKITPNFRRRVVWFTHYPFTLSLFRRTKDEHIYHWLSDNPAQEIQTKDINIFDLDLPSYYTSPTSDIHIRHEQAGASLAVFDKTFGKTFRRYTKDLPTEYIDVTVDFSTEGYYLRWVDDFGFIQYFLFAKGDEELTIAPSEYTVTESETNAARPVSIHTERTITCAAVNIAPDIAPLVSSVINSKRIELYDNGEWISATIEGGSKLDLGEVLQDFEIKLKIKRDNQDLQ